MNEFIIQHDAILRNIVLAKACSYDLMTLHLVVGIPDCFGGMKGLW